MEQYLQKGALSGMMNTLGLRFLIAAAALVWFVWLWGLSVPAVVAGLALGLLGQMALTRTRARFADAREDAARKRLGGEMMLEELLLCPPQEAHRLTAALLSARYPLKLTDADQHGALCLMGRETLLVACLQRPRDAELSTSDIAALQRECRQRRADRGILCLTCKSCGKAETYAATGKVPVRIIPVSMLLSLLGDAAPATDEQLIALKARRKRLAAVERVSDRVLHPGKARRYMVYGVGLMLLYLLTGLRYYPIPAAVCMGLGAACRCRQRQVDAL